MVARHVFDLHAECPLVDRRQWDYYELTMQTDETIDVAELEQIVDSVRGIKATQEQIAELIKAHFDHGVLIEITGRHSLTSRTIVNA